MKWIKILIQKFISEAGIKAAAGNDEESRKIARKIKNGWNFFPDRGWRLGQ